ncbi:NADH-quinone oxidoreductase subunit F [Chloroflexota bacterium]
MPEERIVLKNCGIIDPRNINTCLAQDGFKALRNAWEMAPEQVVQIIKDSGLRGRGGAGFPSGLKLELASKAPGDEKYVICNADEGEVGTFKDRYILERDPFTLVEAMAIVGYAVGARKGYIYLRAEYHYLLKLLLNAIAQAKGKGFLGDGEHKFDIEVREGAGAYVCGEESALMESIEGRRGESRYRPPFPPTQGLFGMPTTINNVETLMNIPRIVLNGADWFNQMGTERSKGTKVFSVSGDVQKPGVYELALGSPLRELVEGLALAEKVKMVQVGGASGRVLPSDKMDTPLSFENVLGAGAIIVFDESRDVIDIARKTMEFFAEESCGKCAPCRQGNEALLEMLERFSEGQGLREDIKALQDVSSAMMLASLCGLGQASPNVVMDTLQYFPDAYESRIVP